MQGPWIKAYAALEVHRKTARMAASLGCIPVSVIGGIIAVWWMADREATPDGFLSGVTREDIDAKVQVPGFAEAMEAVGWLEVLHDGVQFPEFDKHMGQKHRNRVRERTKKRRQRARAACPTPVPRGHDGDTRGTPGDCPPSVPEMSPQTETKTSVKSGAPNPSGSTHLGAREGALDSPAPEPVKKSSSKAKPKAKKRPAFDWREDIQATEFAALAQHPGFIEAWEGWTAQRKALKAKPLTQASIKGTWRDYKHDPAALLAAIAWSTKKNYQGLFDDPAYQGGSGGPTSYSRPQTGQEVVASLRRKMAAQRESDGEAPRDVVFEPLFKTLPMPVKREA